MWTPDSRWVSGIMLGASISAAGMPTAQAAAGYAIGECIIANVKDQGIQIQPDTDADSYMTKYHNNNDHRYKKYYTAGSSSFEGGAIKFLIPPRHGKVVLLNDPSASDERWYDPSPVDKSWHHYWPDKGYTGTDKFVMQIEKHGIKVKIYYTIHVLDEDQDNPASYCGPGEDEWKISQVVVDDDNGTASALMPQPLGQPLPQVPYDLSLLALAIRRLSQPEWLTST